MSESYRSGYCPYVCLPMILLLTVALAGYFDCRCSCDLIDVVQIFVFILRVLVIVVTCQHFPALEGICAPIAVQEDAQR